MGRVSYDLKLPGIIIGSSMAVPDEILDQDTWAVKEYIALQHTGHDLEWIWENGGDIEYDVLVIHDICTIQLKVKTKHKDTLFKWESLMPSQQEKVCELIDSMVKS